MIEIKEGSYWRPKKSEKGVNWQVVGVGDDYVALMSDTLRFPNGNRSMFRDKTKFLKGWVNVKPTPSGLVLKKAPRQKRMRI